MQPASTNGGGGSTNGMATAWGRFTSRRQRLTGSIGGTAASLAYDPAMRLYQLTGAATARFGYDPGSGDRSVARLGSNNLNRNMDGRSDNESAGESRRELVHCHRNSCHRNSISLMTINRNINMKKRTRMIFGIILLIFGVAILGYSVAEAILVEAVVGMAKSVCAEPEVDRSILTKASPYVGSLLTVAGLALLLAPWLRNYRR